MLLNDNRPIPDELFKIGDDRPTTVKRYQRIAVKRGLSKNLTKMMRIDRLDEIHRLAHHIDTRQSSYVHFS